MPRRHCLFPRWSSEWGIRRGGQVLPPGPPTSRPGPPRRVSPPGLSHSTPGPCHDARSRPPKDRPELVQRAYHELYARVQEWEAEYGLTLLELQGCLVRAAGQLNAALVKAEREGSAEANSGGFPLKAPTRDLSES